MGKSTTRKISRRPYDSLSDDEKVRKNWNKTLKLYESKEWSVAILRCGTCLELAVNFAIRQELVEDRMLPLPFVNRLLKNSNGLHNKYQNIYLPIMEEYKEYDSLKVLWSNTIAKVNTERNAVAHRGEFKNKVLSTEIMLKTHAALIKILGLHSSKKRIKPFET